jgi:hypothetical protein
MGDVQIEPIRGLPAHLPEGERILWQGTPHWPTLARRTFHVPALAIYLGCAVLARGASFAWAGAPMADVLGAMLVVLPVAATGVGVVLLLAYLHARTTVYTLTNRRVVMRYGVAFPMSVNVPLRIVSAASVKLYPSGTGELPLQLSGQDRMSYLHLWPHARPGKFKRPEPMLRAVPDVSTVARLLAEHLQTAQARDPRPTAAPATPPARGEPAMA